MKKQISLFFSILLLLSSIGCSVLKQPIVYNTNTVGISMPSENDPRWLRDGQKMKSQLEACGYYVDLLYANDDSSKQASQISSLIAEGCKVIVIAAVDNESLSDVLSQAKKVGTSIIAYDTLIMDSENVSYYVTFNNSLIGVIQGEYIEKELGLQDVTDQVFNIEYIAGDIEDINSVLYFDGAMSVLQKYVDSGVLQTPSNQIATKISSGYDRSLISTPNWSSDEVQVRFNDILSSYYSSNTSLDAILAPNDSTALGAIKALRSKYKGKSPIITGQDCDKKNVPYIIDGIQSMSVFKDSFILVSRTVKMVDALMKDSDPTVNDTNTYNNNVIIVPSFLCEPTICTSDNYEEILINSGYYTYDDFE